MDFEPKINKIVNKLDRETVFFLRAFFYGFWKGSGRIWGGVGRSWRLLGHFWASLFGAFIWREVKKRRLSAKSAQDPFPKRLLEAPGIDFDSILKGLGRVLGRVLNDLAKIWRVKKWCCVGPSFSILRSGCWCFWKCLGQKQGALRYHT